MGSTSSSTTGRTSPRSRTPASSTATRTPATCPRSRASGPGHKSRPLSSSAMRRVGVVFAALGAVCAFASAAAAQGVDETCTLVLTKTDPATVNVAYPDEAAIYWSGRYQAVPGTRIRITGRYPHARYMSFNVDDSAQRPLDARADVELVPDPGSSNPFAAGGSRTASR